MNNPLSWDSHYFVPVVVLTATILLYPVSYFVPRLFPGMLRRRGVAEPNVAIWSVVLARVFGGLTLGLPPLLIALVLLPPSSNRYGFNLNRAWASTGVALLAWAVVVAAFWFLRRAWPGFFKGYPEIDARCWDARLLALNAASWAFYLVPYEFLFRGFLLYPLAEAYGGWIATLVTTGLYSFTHLVKQPQEQFVTIFVGLLFGAVGVWSGSILAPVLIHVFTAPVNDYFAIGTRPEMRICGKCPPAVTVGGH